MTEAAGQITANPLDPAARRDGSVAYRSGSVSRFSVRRAGRSRR